MILAALTIIFVVAKIWGLLDWSWWLVLLPAIIHVFIVVLGMVFIFVLALLGYDVKK
jgi:hypothetical protein